MSYTTRQSLSEYLEVSQMELPEDVEKLIRNASDLIDYATLNRAEAGTIAEKATNQQVEYWIELGGEIDVVGMPLNYSAGDVKVSYVGYGESTSMSKLAPKAQRTLLLNNLMGRTASRL
jgi:hypothetical protein